ncbi:hypothetical protein AVEN_209833-1 [Araneus ventricosus]|uniref:Uncharacterized protein n=1 Tax=Araneus ventricosus TaxID=182803 RepID=A0A4Y2G1S7_ARAVE|nr:hypothetical protein AVEN_209833-1 [Araneus ventricosus]
MWVFHRSYKDVNAHRKLPFGTSSIAYVTALFSELENHCLLRKFFTRFKSHMGRNQENRLIVEIPECNALTANLKARGICEPAPYCYGVPMTWSSLRREVFNTYNH